MSYAICRIQKISSPKDIAGIQIHNRRERTHSNSNPDIDFSLSNNNYSLINMPDISYNKLIDERLKDGYTGKKAIRKDAVRMCEIIFTSDHEFFENISFEKQNSYFIDCYEFACKRYGKDNIISAVVHLDEATPHMHIDFVPLTSDGRLSAKSILGGKIQMQQLQDSFYNTVGTKYQLERGRRADLDNPEDKPVRHLTSAEYKAQKHLDELQGKILTQQELNAVNGKKSITGALKKVKYEDYLALKRTAEKVEDVILREQQLDKKEKELQTLENQINEKIQKLSDMEAEIQKRFDDVKEEKMNQIEEKCRHMFINAMNETELLKQEAEKNCDNLLNDTAISCHRQLEEAEREHRQINLLKRILKLPLNTTYQQLISDLQHQGYDIQSGYTIERCAKDKARVTNGLITEYISLSEENKSYAVKQLIKEFECSEEIANKIIIKAKSQSITDSLLQKAKEYQKRQQEHPKKARFSVEDLNSEKYAPRSSNKSENKSKGHER